MQAVMLTFGDDDDNDDDDVVDDDDDSSVGNGGASTLLTCVKTHSHAKTTLTRLKFQKKNNRRAQRCHAVLGNKLINKPQSR